MSIWSNLWMAPGGIIIKFVYNPSHHTCWPYSHEVNSQIKTNHHDMVIMVANAQHQKYLSLTRRKNTSRWEKIYYRTQSYKWCTALIALFTRLCTCGGRFYKPTHSQPPCMRALHAFNTPPCRIKCLRNTRLNIK